jgi:hypothetical protein
MTRKIMLAAAFLFLLNSLNCSPNNNGAATAKEADCDRDCLSGFITQYLDAMIARTPENLPLAEGARFTENNTEMELGEGLWKNISGLRDYRRDILDVREGNAVSFLVVEENDNQVLFVLRLGIENNLISEIETMVVRSRAEGMLFNLDNLQTVTATMNYVPRQDQLNSRDEIVAMALTYPEGLRIGSFVEADSPMADDSFRYENGQLMAGPGCTFFAGCEHMKTQRIPTLAGITHRIIAVDEEMGVVAVRMNFGPGSTFQGDGELDVWHSFKIYDDEIHAAEAYCKVEPAGSTSIWD